MKLRSDVSEYGFALSELGRRNPKALNIIKEQINEIPENAVNDVQRIISKAILRRGRSSRYLASGLIPTANREFIEGANLSDEVYSSIERISKALAEAGCPRRKRKAKPKKLPYFI